MFSQVHRQRFMLIIIFSLVSVAVVGLILYAMKSNISLFYTPSELRAATVPELATVRVGGMVREGSIHYIDNQKLKNTLHVQFVVHDLQDEITVDYHGVLPDLFREGQGVVIQGYWQPPNFQAIQVLAKHDENYMPPKIMQAMLEKK